MQEKTQTAAALRKQELYANPFHSSFTPFSVTSGFNVAATTQTKATERILKAVSG